MFLSFPLAFLDLTFIFSTGKFYNSISSLGSLPSAIVKLIVPYVLTPPISFIIDHLAFVYLRIITISLLIIFQFNWIFADYIFFCWFSFLKPWKPRPFFLILLISLITLLISLLSIIPRTSPSYNIEDKQSCWKHFLKCTYFNLIFIRININISININIKY